MLALLLPFITGLANTARSITQSITQLEEAKVKAKSDKELASINAELQEVNARRDALVAEAGNRISGTLNAVTRGALALGPVAILLKFLLWDKTVGSFMGCASGSPIADPDRCYSFRTDPLDPNMWWVIIACVGFYFLTSKPRK